nr:MAG TPA: RNA polymerse subunit H [Caudoviricetes sp.]
MLNKVSGISNGQSYIVLVNRKTNIKSQTVVYNYSSSILSAYLPIQKGDVVEILYNSTGEVKEFRFIFAEGSHIIQ